MDRKKFLKQSLFAGVGVFASSSMLNSCKKETWQPTKKEVYRSQLNNSFKLDMKHKTYLIVSESNIKSTARGHLNDCRVMAMVKEKPFSFTKDNSKHKGERINEKGIRTIMQSLPAKKKNYTVTVFTQKQKRISMPEQFKKALPGNIKVELVDIGNVAHFLPAEITALLHA